MSVSVSGAQERQPASSEYGDPVAFSDAGEPAYAVTLSQARSKGLPAAPEEEWMRLQAEHPRGLALPTLGMTLQDRPDGRRLSVIPTRGGDNLCLTYARSGSLASAGCFPGLPSSGVQVASLFETGRPDEVFGLADDGVASVIVELADGAQESVPIINQGFVWIADDASARVVRVESVRHGKTSTLDLTGWHPESGG